MAALTALFAASVPIILYLLQFNINRQVQLGVTSKRLEGYTRLWELMRVVAPTDLEFDHMVPLLAGQRDDLYTKLTEWYFQQGNGIFLSRHSRTSIWP